MREALHVLDNEPVRLPLSATTEEINNFKKLADKDLYQCPYCHAKLIVKSGEERGLYFSHQHSESCEISRKVDKAEKKYSKQVARETKKHKVIIDIIYDELVVQSKIKPNIEVEYGFKAMPDLNEYPDIWVKVDNKELQSLLLLT
ncbi:hypothetical protein H1D32_21085 [Anaerobacillus sp. CMMVII]|uniref:competence protein CoiA n=1 Tax=Anaerobacillus sp. CMMVII TaxID=2755588 RepID=UPI0021B8320C|nr:competence protein CoiA [Anaerobacillus sp. CMMVII]MCT8139973.1 hypothetical protein [Anaerobacillus sp. CMMVII]